MRDLTQRLTRSLWPPIKQDTGGQRAETNQRQSRSEAARQFFRRSRIADVGQQVEAAACIGSVERCT